MKLFEITFMVTETCNNGKERRIKKTVYAPAERNGSILIDLKSVDKAIAILKSKHFYNIECIDKRMVDLMFTTDEQPARPAYNY